MRSYYAYVVCRRNEIIRWGGKINEKSMAALLQPKLLIQFGHMRYRFEALVDKSLIAKQIFKVLFSNSWKMDFCDFKQKSKNFMSNSKILKIEIEIQKSLRQLNLYCPKLQSNTS